MRKVSNLLISICSLLLITSCAGVQQTIYFKADTESGIKNGKQFDYNTKKNSYSYCMDSNMVYINVENAERLVAIGPAPVPAIPMFLFFRKNEPPKLEVNMFFDINETYGINLEAVRFVNNNKNLQPLKIEYITNGNVDVISGSNVFEAEKPTHLRWYFEQEVKKVKQIDIYIDSLTVDNTTMFLPPLKLKQKRYCEYNPLMVGHF